VGLGEAQLGKEGKGRGERAGLLLRAKGESQESEPMIIFLFSFPFLFPRFGM
jgi:hypothetical protein